jgi:hypothetical protein
MTFSFKIFEPKKVSLEPMVEITKSGRLFFNKQASNLLENNKFCMLGYDQENNAIGIQPVATEEPNSFPIRYTIGGAYIGAKHFLRHFNILPQTNMERPPIVDGTYLVVTL